MRYFDDEYTIIDRGLHLYASVVKYSCQRMWFNLMHEDSHCLMGQCLLSCEIDIRCSFRVRSAMLRTPFHRNSLFLSYSAMDRENMTEKLIRMVSLYLPSIGIDTKELLFLNATVVKDTPSMRRFREITRRSEELLIWEDVR